MTEQAKQVRRAFRLRTRLSFEELDSLVAQYARLPYQITIGGLDETKSVPAKLMILRFEDPEDCERLRVIFARQSAPLRAPTTSAPAPIRPRAFSAQRAAAKTASRV